MIAGYQLERYCPAISKTQTITNGRMRGAWLNMICNLTKIVYNLTKIDHKNSKWRGLNCKTLLSSLSRGATIWIPLPSVPSALS